MREAEIEVGKVDRDEHVGPGRLGVGQEPAVDRVRAGQHARHFEEAGHRQALEIGDEVGTSAAKLLAAEAGDDRGWIELEKLAGERAGVQVPGRLAAGNHDAHGSRTAPYDRPREQIRSEGNVVLEGAHAAREHRQPARLDDGGERHLETVDASVSENCSSIVVRPAAPAGAS